MQSLPRQHQYLIMALAALQLVVIGTNHSLGYFSLYWYCDFAPTLFAVLVYLQNLQAVKGFVSIILLGQLGYIVATVTKLATGVALAEFDFKYALTPTYVTATILIHLTALIVLIATYKVRPTRDALWYALIILTVTYLVILTSATPLGDTLTNYNFIFHSHILASFPYYTETWVILGFIGIVVPTHFLQVALFQLSQRYRG